jgi:hypothetical protein
VREGLSSSYVVAGEAEMDEIVGILGDVLAGAAAA